MIWRNSCNSSGFMLVEVIIALAVLTSVLFIVSQFTIRTTMRFAAEHGRLSKGLIVNNKLFSSLQKGFKKKGPEKEKLEKHECTVTTELRDIAKNSSLKSFRKRVKLLNVAAEWKKSGRSESYKLVGFALVASEAKS